MTTGADNANRNDADKGSSDGDRCSVLGDGHSERSGAVERVAGGKLVKMPSARLPSAAASEAAALISLIERLATDPNVDVERVERMYAMYEKAAARNAKAAYLEALSELQPKLPVIGRSKAIKIKDEIRSKYAPWEAIVDQIKPHLDANGFSLSFRVSQGDGRITITGILGHRGGHSEETSMSLPIDDSGAKNNVQGWGSSLSYGKRYVGSALLNLVTRDEDDDGSAAGRGATITDAQEDAIRDALETNGKQIPAFCAYFKVQKLSDLKASDFDLAIKAIEGKRHG